ncbi:TlpA family protein disulfide reductase [Christiangramia sp. LLG6405-1]|uniref:TlpA family protein disulfide reductase n=1 Tax=Christiangramia sp. LLG6405-1 TaxID=3160832 RepID=UPI0038647387
MKIQLFVLAFVLFSTEFFGQENLDDRYYFTEALYENLSDYNKKADAAFRAKDFEKGRELFKEFTSEQLAGSYMNNFKFKDLRKRDVELYDFDKPTFLITYASWCIPAKGEIPAINELAKEYADKVDFIILFWDNRKTVKKLSDQFNSEISVVYVDESENNGGYVVKQLKHSLGLPTCFLLSEDKRITSIRRSIFSGPATDLETAYQKNYIALETSITKNLVPEYDEVYADNVIVD